jgi:hypothetical protein
MTSLLAVDIGIRTGLAFYDGSGRLCWYRSHNFGNISRLRRAVYNTLRDLPGLTHIVLEGGGPLAEVWKKEAKRRGINVIRISAEQWRGLLMYQRQQTDATKAKNTAKELAKRVIDWFGAPKPTSLRHDTAEAVLIGLWAVLSLGWIDPDKTLMAANFRKLSL